MEEEDDDTESFDKEVILEEMKEEEKKKEEAKAFANRGELICDNKEMIAQLRKERKMESKAQKKDHKE